MKITDNLLHNQNYMFSEQLCKEKLVDIAIISSRIKGSGVKKIILIILCLIIFPGISISITHGYPEIFGPILWCFLILVTIGCDNRYEHSQKRSDKKKILTKLKEELESVMWQHKGYTIYGKPSLWSRSYSKASEKGHIYFKDY